MNRKGLEKLREKKRAAAVLFGVLLSFSLFSSPSWAGEGTEGAAPYGTAQELESITVTANKIEEDVTDVPQSITVLDAYTLEEKGIKDLPDVVREIPNMWSTPNSASAVGNTVSYRGLNTSVFTSNNPVVVYIDGVPYSLAYGFDASLVNAQRIEVLRGPQGTLYGKEAIGAVINIVSKDPEDRWQGTIGAEYGSFNSVLGTVNLSGPLVPNTLFLGISGQYRRDDGWIENDYPGMEEDANREKDHKISSYLLYKPNDRFSARLTLSRDYSKDYWEDGYGLPTGSTVGEFDRDDAEHVDYDEKVFQLTESNTQSLNLSYELDPFTLTSTTTHRVLEAKGNFDADFGNNTLYAGLATFNNSETDTWTQEVRLASNNTAGLRWVGGVYFDIEEHDVGPYGAQFPYYDAAGTFYGNFEVNAESVTDTNTQAAFGQVMVPFADAFELTLGGRYQRIEKEIDLSSYYLPMGVSGAAYYQLKADKTWNAFLPKVALSYAVNDDWTAYASWSKGYLPGGFNFFATQGTARDNSFDPQQSTNYEVGIKGAFSRFRVAASLFYMDIEDIHVYKSLGGGIYLSGNADRAHSQGAELEMTWFLTDTLELTAAVGIIDAEYDDYDAGDGVVFDGERIQETPDHTARIGLAYYHPGGLYARTDVTNVGEVYFYNDTNQEFEKESSYLIVDVKVGYRFTPLDIYVFGKNLTDEEYVNGFRANSLASVATFGEPRTFGIGVRYKF